MAKKRIDLAAAKAKKQKKILVVFGVLLLAVAAFQGPKLLKGSAPPEAAPEDSSLTPVSTTPALKAAAGSTAVVATKGSAVVAGVALPGGTVVRVAPSQLASFTLFEVKDPFVPRIKNEPTAEEVAADAFYNANGEAPPESAPATDTTAGGSTAPAGSAPAPAPATEPPPPVVYATINFDGEPQQLQVKQQFPAPDPLFVLRSLKKKFVKIGVAGGSFDDGQTITLKLGKRVTLVNTATGVRYVLQLVYTGAAPETIQGFTTDQTQPATAGAAAGTTTPATTTTVAP